MADKKLRKLKRADLLELLLEQSRENDQLKEEVAQLKARLENRRIRTEQAGNIAEAALQLNGVFEAAQAAADQYLANIREAADQYLANIRKAGEQSEQSSCPDHKEG